MPKPQASSTLVNVAEHAELRLVRLLAESAPTQLLSPTFESDCEACIANADAPGLIRTIIHDDGAMSSLYGIDPIEDAVSAFSLLAALLDRVGGGCGEEEVRLLACEVADAVVGGVKLVGGVKEEGFGRKRIAMLSVLYNLRSNGSEKCRLLSRIVSLAVEIDPQALERGRQLGDVLDPDRIVSTLNSWGGDVSKDDRRVLFRAAADAFGQSHSDMTSSSLRQRYLLLLVGSYDDESEVDKQALESTKDAAIGAIKDPVTLFAEQRGMLVMPAISALAANKSTQPLHGLLKIFQEGKLEDYQLFARQHEQTIVKQYDLSPEQCIRNMRLLSLCSLASEHDEIPYSAIAETLQIDEHRDVEGWVISAVSSGLLVAKMDQLQKVVMVERCVVRRFDRDQWLSLQRRLETWKKNVRTVLDGLDQSRRAAGMQQI